jgi:TonB-linked SusC/RagA family outer membrane protein
MRKQLLLLLFSLFAVTGFSRTVTGVVTQAKDNEPVIGATVMVHGTQKGAATDFDGKYSIDVNDNDVLDFSYVGMTPTSVKVGTKTTINVALKENSKVLQEVVVTAMGQTQEKKKLNFAVQQLDADQVTAGGNVNFANSLQGKVAGLQVSTGGGSPNSSTQVIIRAISSINPSQNNEPLMIVDGVPIRGQGSALADINPNDIESMTVLKGAAASALYGQDAANGVIMINTKSGKNGKMVVTASGGWEISNAMRTPKIQSMYTPGSKGFYKENAGGGGWGAPLNSTDKVYDNVGDFLGTGFMQKYDLSLSGGTEKFSTYSSVSYMRNAGVVPKDYKDQLNVFMKANYNPSKQLKFQFTTSYKESQARGFGNSMSTIYGWAINRDMSDYKTITGYPNWANRYDNWDAYTDQERIGAIVSPYYGRYMDKSKTESTRIIVNGQVSYEPLKDLVFTGKIGYDKGYSTYDSYTVPRFQTSDFLNPTDPNVASVLNENASRFGEYVFEPSRGEQLTAQFLATYKREIIPDLTADLLYGMEYKQTRGYEAQLAGDRFLLGGDFYSFNNLDYSLFDDNSNMFYLYHTKKNKYGYFGELRFDYKSLAQLSVTGRFDGSSTLKQVDPTYFYPSITAGVIFSELFHLQNSWFSYGKIRGNWAKVGKDCPAYLFTDTYKRWSTFPDGGYGIDPTTSRAITLEPEMTKTWEIGADLRFFNSWTRLDAAYYSSIVDNQIVSVRVSPASGTILQTRNEGKIKNYGVELTLNQDIMKSQDFGWTALFNFSFNRGKVLSLPESLTELQGTQYGDIFPTAYLNGSTTAISGKDYKRSTNGDVLINSQGYPIISPNKGNLIGNREPDFLMGLGSTFRYKDLSLSFLLDGREGGDVVNVTARSLISSGQHHLYDKYRNREIIFKGVIDNGDGTYTPNTKAVILDQNTVNTYFYAVSSNFIEDGSYIRLSYVTLAYDFTKMLSHNCPIKGLSASLTGRNLFLLTKYSGTDPQILVGTQGGTGGTGIDDFSVPTNRSFNLTVKATF